MSNKFNVRLSFKGEGDLTFQLPIIGEVTIWAGRDIFLVGATTEIVETLRQYRSMKLEHKLNADSKGCYKVIEVDNIDRIPYGLYRPVAVPKAENISDLKKTLIRSNDFIPVDEAGKSTAEELKVKESNRIKTVKDELTTLGADIVETDDGMIINGVSELKGAETESHNDHRIAMSIAIAGLKASGKTTILNSECVDISFPKFYDYIEKL